MCECKALYGGSLNKQVENKEACDRTKDDFTSVYKKAFTRKSTIRYSIVKHSVLRSEPDLCTYVFCDFWPKEVAVSSHPPESFWNYIRPTGCLEGEGLEKPSKYVYVKPDKAVFQSEYPDILAGPFTEYVVLNSVTNPEHPFEDVHNCFERLVKMNPKMKRYIDKEPDHNILVTDYSNRGRTVYQVNYCCLKDGFESKKSRDRQRVSLPHDWGEVPVTTQRASYRVPDRLATWDLKPRPVQPPASVLDPNLKEREILQVTTGVSEYESRVGVLGDMIMQDQLHGKHQDGLECKKYDQMMQTYEK